MKSFLVDTDTVKSVFSHFDNSTLGEFRDSIDAIIKKRMARPGSGSPKQPESISRLSGGSLCAEPYRRTTIAESDS